MDWQVITDAVSTAQTLDGAERDRFFTDLDTSSPELSEIVRDFVKNRSDLDAFMMTAVGDYLSVDDPIYDTGDNVGIWKIQSLIGSGGMGDVYKAKRADELYDQTVALKVMKGTDPKRQSRFASERQRLAALNHPGIAMIVDGGISNEDFPYMAMEYVDGVSIGEYCKNKNLNQTQTLTLFRQVCEVVASAHNNLVLHRDLKSDNILVTDKGRVKLVDFGISTFLDEDDDIGKAPFSLGSAAPEQLRGEPVSTQTDIFALGVLLHQLLTQRLPLRQPDGGVKAKHDNLSDDLKAIIEKALKDSPRERYESVSALSADIGAKINHEPVKAFEGSAFYRLKKLVRRAPLASALSAGILATLIGGIGVSQHYARTAQAEAVRANAELATAEWRTDQSKLRERISNAKSQMMIYAFGQNDVDQLSEHLLDYQAQNLEEQKKRNPFHTASTTYAIGHHFLSRNDYKKALSIFEPWITEGYGGNAQLLSYGHVNLGHTYRALGEKEKAFEMFKKSEAFYAGTPDEYSMDHAAAAIEMAILAKDQDVVDKALETVNVTLSDQENIYAKMYLLSKMHSLEYDRGNWDGAYSTIRQSVDIIDSNESRLTQGSDVRRLKLAHVEMFYKGDLEAAKIQINEARRINEEMKGENMITARIHQHQASIDWLEGNTASAISAYEISLPIVEKYEGKEDSYPDFLARLVIFKSDMGQFDEAHELLKEAQSIEVKSPSSWVNLAEVYLMAGEGNLEQAQFNYNEAKTSNASWSGHLEMKAFLEALEKQGLVL